MLTPMVLSTQYHVLIRPCAGEAHWKIGLAERRIQTHKRITEKLSLGDLFYPLNGSVQQLIDRATTAKNMHCTKGGISPYAWVTGAYCKHPLLDSEHAPPVASISDKSDPFVTHLMRKARAAERFLREEARSILKLAKTPGLVS